MRQHTFELLSEFDRLERYLHKYRKPGICHSERKVGQAQACAHKGLKNLSVTEREFSEGQRLMIFANTF
jgi:hypothetical protein